MVLNNNHSITLNLLSWVLINYTITDQIVTFLEGFWVSDCCLMPIQQFFRQMQLVIYKGSSLNEVPYWIIEIQHVIYNNMIEIKDFYLSC